MNTLINVLENQPLQPSLFREEKTNSNVDIDGYSVITDEFWTAKQRQSCSLHEIAYRACFKAQLPNFFITRLTENGETVYDPFSGRGTTVIESALCGRNAIANDINPISRILSEGRTKIPTIQEIKNRLEEIKIDESLTSDIDLSMFFHKETLQEIISLKNYFLQKSELDCIDKWLRMVATNRLTGHSKGYFSVYTLPPNQAVSTERQVKINEKYQQIPTYRDTKQIIYNKSISLLKDLSPTQKANLQNSKVQYLNKDARNTPEIFDETISLTVTSPPFLDVVQYAQDNWLRCWFNGIDSKEVEKEITMAKTIEKWSEIMSDVFKELYRITKKGGWIVFEVGEVKNGKINLEDYVLPIGEKAGFTCNCVMINQQTFTKTANIWGVSNNKKGTNTNRIVIFKK